MTWLEFFDGLTHRPPVYRTATTPVYSNAAFQILAYALEAITGKKFETMLDESILRPLKMSETSLFAPTTQTNGVIPVNETASWWAINMGDLAP
jgi:CubicO group peptidase (beta-lactamase class C family)